VFLLSETNEFGITWSNFGINITNYNILTNITMNILNIVIFLFLGLYCDIMVPNDSKKGMLISIKNMCKKRHFFRQELCSEVIEQPSLEPISLIQ